MTADRDGDREHQDDKAPDEIHGEGLVHGRLVRARAGPARGRARRTQGSPQPRRLSIRRGTRSGWSRTRAASRMRGLLRPKRHFASGLGLVLARDAHELEPEAGNALQKPLDMRLVSEQPDDGRPSLCALDRIPSNTLHTADSTPPRRRGGSGRCPRTTLTADGASACSGHARSPG